MPVQETLDGIDELRHAELPVGAVIVNSDRPAVLTPAHLRDAREGALDREGIGRAVLASDVVTSRHQPDVQDVVASLLDEARDHAERVSVADQERARLALVDAPLVSLPHLPTGIDLGALYELASVLRAGGFGDDGGHPRATETPA
jgi:hypothetical protein